MTGSAITQMLTVNISPAVKRRSVSIGIVAVMAGVTQMVRICSSLTHVSRIVKAHSVIRASAVHMAVKVSAMAGITVTTTVCAAYAARTEHVGIGALVWVETLHRLHVEILVLIAYMIAGLAALGLGLWALHQYWPF